MNARGRRRAALAAVVLAVAVAVRPAAAVVPPDDPLGRLADEVMAFLVSDVGEGGIRTNDGDPQGYPVPPYFYHYAIKDWNDLWSCGPGYPGYCAVSYPAYTASVAIDAFLDYRRWSGDPAMLDRARAYADWVLEHRTPAGDLYGRLPYSTQTEGVMGGGWDGPAIETDKPAMFALRLLRLHDATGEDAYATAALEIADALASTQLDGDVADRGRWPWRVVPADGTVTQDYTSHLQPAVRLFDTLAERTGSVVYAAARDRAWWWLLANPCLPSSPSFQRWEGFYEDQSPEQQLGKDDHYSAHEMIVELIARRPLGWQAMAVTILDSVTARYLDAGPQSATWPYEPVTLEWEGWPVATYAASLQYARTALLLHGTLAGHALQDDAWRERALQMVDVCTHGQYDVGVPADGRMRTTVRDLVGIPNTESWYEQNFNTVKYALELMALAPERAPADEDHLLSADRELTAIAYDEGGWAVRYATAGGAGRETARLAAAPDVVLAGGVALPQLAHADDPGPGWHWDAGRGVLTVSHDTSPVQIGREPTAVAPDGAPGSHPRLVAAGAGPVQLRLSLPRAAAVDLDVCDLRGRLTRRLLAGARLAGGEHAFAWDGRDGRGASAAAGVYVARARTRPGGGCVAHILLVR